MARIVVKDIPKDIKITEEEKTIIRSDLVNISISLPLGKIVQPVGGPGVADIGILMCSKTLDTDIIEHTGIIER